MDSRCLRLIERMFVRFKRHERVFMYINLEDVRAVILERDGREKESDQISERVSEQIRREGIYIYTCRRQTGSRETIHNR